MSTEVVHAPESHAVAVPAPIGKGVSITHDASGRVDADARHHAKQLDTDTLAGYDLTAAVTQTLTPVQDRPQASLPGSQESRYSAASKHSVDSTAAMSSVEGTSDRQLTPTSSQSGFDFPSSPSHAPPYVTSPNATGGLPSYEPLASYDSNYHAPKSPVSIGRPVLYHVDAAAGQKRTASGVIKSQRVGSAESGGQEAGGDQQRSRTTSTASRSSQVGELTAQLRARLTYAKVKVKHGWETRTLDEIENITSIPTSPASAKTHSTRNYQSPYSRINGDGIGSSPAVNGGLHPADRLVTAPSRQLDYGQIPGQHGEHAQQTHPPPVVDEPRARGTLAPPVDFSNPRRNPNGIQQIPSLGRNGSNSTHSGSNLSAASALQNYPARNGHLKTPSQSAMEQDAIETLLFMRSPGNSANFGRPQPTQQSQQQQPQTSGAPTLPPISQVLPVSEGAAVARLGKVMTADGNGINGGGPGGPVGPHSNPVNSIRKPPFPPPRPGPLITEEQPPISPRKRALEESVLANANLHDSQGIDDALDEIRRRAVLEGETDGADSSDEDDGVA